MMNALISSAAGTIPTIVKSVSFGMKYCTGRSTAIGMINKPIIRSACAGSRAVQRVVALRDERQHDEHADAGHGADHAASERAEMEVAVEVEVLQHRAGEQTEAQRRERRAASS